MIVAMTAMRTWLHLFILWFSLRLSAERRGEDSSEASDERAAVHGGAMLAPGHTAGKVGADASPPPPWRAWICHDVPRSGLTVPHP